MVFNCWSCESPLGVTDFGRGDHCLKCGKDTKVCKNCKYFDPSAYNQCHENQAERVVEKDRSNFCDYFAPFEGIGKLNSQEQKLNQLSAAEALFKKK